MQRQRGTRVVTARAAARPPPRLPRLPAYQHAVPRGHASMCTMQAGPTPPHPVPSQPCTYPHLHHHHHHPPGLGEAYMDGDYEVDDLGGLLAVATANANNIEVRAGSTPWITPTLRYSPLCFPASCTVFGRGVARLRCVVCDGLCSSAGARERAACPLFQSAVSMPAGVARPAGRVQLAGRPAAGHGPRRPLQHARGQPPQHRGALRRRQGGQGLLGGRDSRRRSAARLAGRERGVLARQ